MSIEELKSKISLYNKSSDFALIERAYLFAKKNHEGVLRASGKPYISHPLAVAEIVADLKQDDESICAALLHDTVEDSNIPIEQISTLFSPEIATLVQGVTKLSKLVYDSKEQRRAENFRKMFLAMGEDLRVIIIKLADRLHNMQTLEWLTKERQIDVALETREIFAPLAHRLGMWRLKWELEDAAFKYLESDKYAEISRKVAESRASREIYIASFVEKLKGFLQELSLNAEVRGRPKHLFSIYKKMESQHLAFEEIYDLTAVRVIVDSVKDCYTVLGIVHANWKPIPGRFKDYIGVPKSNGYQSLHTTVIVGEGKPVEVQIRTAEMHKIAEYGVAAHWVYKESKTDKKFDKKIAWLRQILDTKTEMQDPKDFLDSLKIDLFEDEVFVFTPKGEVIQLQQGSTPIDFAYHVHTQVGHRCVGVKVNGKIEPLSYRLKNGDIVEIITGKVDAPSIGWLGFVKTSGARAKIRSWFKKLKREESIDRGKKALEEELKRTRITLKIIIEKNLLLPILAQLKLKNEEDLYASVGYGDISTGDFVKKAQRLLLGTIEADEEIKPLIGLSKKKKNIVQGIVVDGIVGIATRISKCCRPIPGDHIVGFITGGKGITIHKKNCQHVINGDMRTSREVHVDWNLDSDITYPVELEVEAFDRVGLLKDILSKISETKTNVAEIKTKTKKGNVAYLRIIVDVKNAEGIKRVLEAIRSIGDVYEVIRYHDR